jgi:hypothetical protein
MEVLAMNGRMVLGIVALVGLSFATRAVADDVVFAYVFEEGVSHSYRVKMNQEMDFSGNAMGQIADLEVTVKCMSVTEGKASMVMTINEADMSREMFGNTAADPLAEAVLGRSVAYSVDATGAVSDIAQEGYYEGWDQISGFVEPLLKAWYVRLPGKAYAVGAEWTDTHRDKGSGGMDTETESTYKFKESKKEKGRDCAIVAGSVTTLLGGKSANPMGTYNVDGEGSGRVEFSFDVSAHLIVKLKAKMNIGMELTPAVGGDTVDANISYQVERELL